jgi:hypothetical protein
MEGQSTLPKRQNNFNLNAVFPCRHLKSQLSEYRAAAQSPRFDPTADDGLIRNDSLDVKMFNLL